MAGGNAVKKSRWPVFQLRAMPEHGPRCGRRPAVGGPGVGLRPSGVLGGGSVPVTGSSTLGVGAGGVGASGPASAPATAGAECGRDPACGSASSGSGRGWCVDVEAPVTTGVVVAAVVTGSAAGSVWSARRWCRHRGGWSRRGRRQRVELDAVACRPPTRPRSSRWRSRRRWPAPAVSTPATVSAVVSPSASSGRRPYELTVPPTSLAHRSFVQVDPFQADGSPAVRMRW